MAFVLTQFETDDYDGWKRETFDLDPAGRKQTANGHIITRGVDDPSQVFVAVEFPSEEEARAFCERLLESGALEGMNVRIPPTVADLADRGEY